MKLPPFLGIDGPPDVAKGEILARAQAVIAAGERLYAWLLVVGEERNMYQQIGHEAVDADALIEEYKASLIAVVGETSGAGPRRLKVQFFVPASDQHSVRCETRYYAIRDNIVSSGIENFETTTLWLRH